jgi:hypothetical protein
LGASYKGGRILMKAGCQYFDAALLFANQIACAAKKIRRAIAVPYVSGHRTNQHPLQAVANGMHGAEGQ